MKRKHWPAPKEKARENMFPRSSKPKVKGKFGPSPDDECFHFHDKGHWSRNYKNYLEDLKKK
jgi:hypothetical protein